jgi:cytochrome c
MRLGAAVAALLVPSSAVAFAQEAAREPGAQAFLQCYSCHSAEPGETDGLEGPNLAGIVGRAIAAQPGFDYSPAMRAFANRHGRWDAALLDRFMADPQAVVPGTAMAGYPGLDDPAQRRTIIEYLSPDPEPQS